MRVDRLGQLSIRTALCGVVPRTIPAHRLVLFFIACCVGLFSIASVSNAQYTPNQIRTGYGFNLLSSDGVSGVTGAGMTVAIIDGGNAPTINSDLSTFSTNYGLPTTLQNGSSPLTTVNLDQNGNVYSGPSSTGGTFETATDPETSLDVEYVHAIAPQAKILLVQIPSLTDTSTYDATTALDNAAHYAASQSGVVAVSISLGSDEYSGEQNTDSYFKNSGHNVAFVASSGDTSNVSTPASSKYVLSVGGTTLNLNPDNTYASETAWSGSGGGTSAFEREPAYQELSVRPAQTGGYRTIPDVSYDADPNTGVYIYDSTPFTQNGYTYSGTYGVGGTSAGAPQWAALIALADQLRMANGLSPYTTDSSASTGTTNVDMNLLYKLYTIYGNTTLYGQMFHDVMSGMNGNNISAGVGYDDVTGLGSPYANELVPYLGAPEPASGAVLVACGLLLQRRREAQKRIP